MSSFDSDFEKMKLDAARRHVFVCIGPDCCSESKGEETWKALKRELKDSNVPALRTKAGCFRICDAGPWMVVYPEGVWYNKVSPERCERIVREHILGGRPVEEWVVKTHALG